MAQFTRAGLLKRGILLFWFLWIGIVVLMNTFDALKAVGLLPHDWQLASGNYEAIANATKKYGAPAWLNLLLLLGAMTWEALCMLLFWRALRHYRVGHGRRWRAVYLAFGTLLALFFTFILMDEVLHVYKIEGDHRGIAVLLLACLLAMQLLPDRIPDS